MNIFILDITPQKAAEAHCNKHVVKMVLETAQLLSTAHHVLKGASYKHLHDKLYKLTHSNHPCAIWVRESRGNYQWAHQLLSALLDEYTFRYGKVHKVRESGLESLLSEPPSTIPPAMHLTDPKLAMPDEYKATGDYMSYIESVVASYRNYYRQGKAELLQYTKRNPPSWL